jgi:hypothetical protein
MNNRLCRFALAAGLIAWSLQLSGFAQVQAAAIRGSVVDSSNAVIPGVLISLRNQQIGTHRQTETTPEGFYRVDGLEAGDYEIQLHASGFAVETYTLTVRAGDYVTVTFELSPGPHTDDVIVASPISGVNTTGFTIAGNVGRFQIENLPLNGRNFLELARLEPGISVVSVANAGAFGNNYQRVSVAGAQYLETRVSVDGAILDDRINGGTALNVSQETVQEFSISTFNFDLSTGTTASGAVNIISRRGGNAVTGSSFAYYRDHHLAAYPGLRRDARNPDPFFARRQTGFSLAGPFVKNRLFWFGNLERNDQDGVFAVSNNHAIFSKLDVVESSPLNFNLINLRLDGVLKNNDSVFLRATLDKNNSIAPPGSMISMPSNWFSATTTAGQLHAGITSFVSQKFIADLRFSHSLLNNDLDALAAQQCVVVPACVGVDGPDIQIFEAPAFRIGHHVTVPKQMRSRTSQMVSNLTWQRNSHRLRAGGEWEHLSLNSIHALYEVPQITLWGPADLAKMPASMGLFDRLPASLKDPSAGAPTVVDILQLPLRNFMIGIGDPMQPGPYGHGDAAHPDLLRFYAGDSWTARQGLTLNVGMAYLRRTNIYNRDLPRPAYLMPVLGPELRPPHRGMNSFEPSAGLAWSVNGKENTVVRAGAGIYHDELNFFRPHLERGFLGPAGNGRVVIDGSVAGLSFLSRPTQVTGQDLLRMLPGIRSQLRSKLGDGTNPAITGIEVIKQGERIFEPNHAVPYAIHVSAGIQRKLASNLLVSADFVSRRFLHFGGFHGVFQRDRNRFNRPKVTGVNDSTGEVSFVRDPVIPLCTPEQATALLPADQCSTGPINVYGSGGSYSYRGLHLKLEGRASANLQLTVGYAFAENTGFVEFSEYDDFHSAYGNMADHRRHRLTISAIYELPRLNLRSRMAKALLNDWSVALISQTDSVPPLDTVLAGVDLDGDGINRTLLPGTRRHNTLGQELSASGLRTLVESYNTNINARTRRVMIGSELIEIRPRTPFNQILSPIQLPEHFFSGDSFITQDVRLTRGISLRERLRLSLIGEVFNVFNIANLSGYSNVLNQGNYGQPSTRAGQVFGSGGPRALQFATRLMF